MSCHRAVGSSHSSFLIGGTLHTVDHQSMVLESNTKKNRGEAHFYSLPLQNKSYIPVCFFNLDPPVRLRSHVHLLIFMFSTLVFPNDRSQIQVRALAPELSQDWPCKVFSGTQVLLIVIHMYLSTHFDHNTTSTFFHLSQCPRTSNCLPLLYCVPSQS